MAIRKKYPVLLIVFVLAVILAMTLQVRFGIGQYPFFALFSPLLRVVDVVSDGLSATIEDYVLLTHAKSENRRLRLEKDRFELERMGFGEIQAENRRLRSLLKLEENTPCRMTAAEVIGREPDARFHALTIGKGSGQGVALNMAVMGPSGLVGRVYAVAPDSAKVLLITDMKSSVAVRLTQSREQVLMDGSGEGPCTLKFVHRDTQVEAGEPVVTSGLDGIFPEGVPVGSVRAVRQLEYGIFQEVDVDPTESFGRLEEVMIIRSGRNCSVGSVNE